MSEPPAPASLCEPRRRGAPAPAESGIGDLMGRARRLPIRAHPRFIISSVRNSNSAIRSWSEFTRALSNDKAPRGRR